MAHPGSPHTRPQLRQRKPSRRSFESRSAFKRQSAAGPDLDSILTRAVISAWLIIFVTYETGGVTSWSFALFLAVLVAAAAGTARAVAAVAKGKEAFRAARAGVLMALALTIPVLFDPHTHEAFDLPKYTVLVIGTLVITGLEVAGAVRTGRLPHVRPGLAALITAWAAWTAVSTFASVDMRLSLLGYRGSYDGLYATLAFSVIALSTAEAFDVGDIPRVMGVLAIAAGSVVATYGLVQLHDFTVHGAPWDFVHWKVGAPNVFSTLGNPNHLGGYVAIALPICLLSGMASPAKWARRGLFLLCATMLLLLLQSGARGGWAATIAAAAVLAAGMWPEIRRRPRVPAIAGLAAVAVGIALVADGGRHFMGAKFSRLITFHGTASGRLDLWDASLRIGAAHPLTGTGPDTFAYVFPRYETAAWAHHLGFQYTSNGAHDIFMNVLADRGAVGLAILLGVVAWAAIAAIRTFRGLRAWATSAEALPRRVSSPKQPRPEPALDVAGHGPARRDPVRRDPAIRRRSENARLQCNGAGLEADRLMLVALVAGLAAFLVQDLFNTEQIALAFSWWLLLGCLSVLAGSSGASRKWALPARFRKTTFSGDSGNGNLPQGSGQPDALEVSADPASGAASGKEHPGPTAEKRYATRTRSRRSKPPRAGGNTGSPHKNWRLRGPLVLACTCLAMATAVTFLAYGTDGPWRADHNYWAATTAQSLYSRAARAGATTTQLSSLASAFFTAVNRAAALDPWEGTYPARAGITLAAAGTAPSAAGTTASAKKHDLVQARSFFERAVRAVPLSSPYHYELAEVLVDLAPLEPGNARGMLLNAEAQERLAVHWTPENPVYSRYLATIRRKLQAAVQ